MAGEWRERRLGDVAEIFDGPHATPAKTEDGPVFLGISHLARGRLVMDETEHLSEEDYVRWTRRVEPRAGDVVFSYETRLGEAARIPPSLRCCLGRRMGLLRARGGAIDQRFLLYAYLGPVFQETLRARTIHGSTVDRIPLTDMPQFPIVIPADIDEQRAIAHILGTLDDKIELNRRVSETLEAMARALFQSWFEDFDPVRAKAAGRDPGLPKPLADLFPARLIDSELGQIPDGWKVGVLDDAVDELEVGGRPEGGVAAYTGGVPSIGAESIVGLGIFDYSKTKYVPREFFDGMTKGHIKSRDVLLYKDGGRPGEFEPHVTIFGDGFPFETAAINEHVYRLRAKPLLGQSFLYFWLSSDLTMEEMRIKGTGVAVPGLNSTQVRSLSIVVPPKPVARAFERLADPCVARVLASCNLSRTLAFLRDALLPKLISGELRVEHVGRVIEETV